MTPSLFCFNLVIEVLLISRRRPSLSLSAEPCFNLVIEVLLISRAIDTPFPRRFLPFQSRNRGSFDFKFTVTVTDGTNTAGFNLVIEVLLISRKPSASQAHRVRHRFNLVIEVLLISRHAEHLSVAVETATFQSRNRGSFDFKV